MSGTSTTSCPGVWSGSDRTRDHRGPDPLGQRPAAAARAKAGRPRGRLVMILVAPPFPTGRLRLALSPNASGRAALGIYRPLTSRGRALRHAVRLASTVPGLPKSDERIADVLIELLGVPADGVCMMASSAAGRRIVGLAAARRLVVVAKVGRADDLALRREAETLTQHAVAGGLRVPPVLLAAAVDGRYVCATVAAAGRPRPEPSVALHLAVDLARREWTHGDLAPWNLIGDPPTVLDWESARPVLTPLFDLAHFMVQSAALLGNGSARSVVHGLCGAGGIGAAYLTAVGIDPARAPDHLLSYLDQVEASQTGAAQVRLRQEIREVMRCR